MDMNLEPSQIHVHILSAQTDIFNSMEDKIYVMETPGPSITFHIPN